MRMVSSESHDSLQVRDKDQDTIKTLTVDSTSSIRYLRSVKRERRPVASLASCALYLGASLTSLRYLSALDVTSISCTRAATMPTAVTGSMEPDVDAEAQPLYIFIEAV